MIPSQNAWPLDADNSVVAWYEHHIWCLYNKNILVTSDKLKWRRLLGHPVHIHALSVNVYSHGFFFAVENSIMFSPNKYNIKNVFCSVCIFFCFIDLSCTQELSSVSFSVDNWIFSFITMVIACFITLQHTSEWSLLITLLCTSTEY